VNDLDSRLIEAIQDGLPIEARPFRQLGLELGITEQEVLSSLSSLRRRGLIRDLSPVFAPRKLGYTTSLACLKVPEERVDEAAEIINEHIEVTHNYLREHEYNVWFAIVAPGDDAVEQVIASIEERTGCGPALRLPYKRIFKLRAVFGVDHR
jgi:DNA-binding Lrp family transcriptional regulator